MTLAVVANMAHGTRLVIRGFLCHDGWADPCIWGPCGGAGTQAKPKTAS